MGEAATPLRVDPLRRVAGLGGHDHDALAILQVGGHRVQRGDVALVPVDQDEDRRPHRGQFLADIRYVLLEYPASQRDGAGMTGVDRGDTVRTARNHKGVEPLGEVGGDQIGGHGVGAAREVRPVLLDAPERQHRDPRPVEEGAHLGGGEPIDGMVQRASTLAGTTGLARGMPWSRRRASAAA